MDASTDPSKPQNRLNPHLPQKCDLARIIDEIAASSFCKRQKLNACAVKGVWEAFCLFICESMKLGKGVMVPTLGYFHVGRVYDNGVLQDDNVVRPTFRLLENRFAGVRQEISRFKPAQRGRMIQPNFHTISRRCRLHRSTCQRVIRDIFVCLGIHIVAGHQLKVEFPLVGQLVTSTKGNIAFEFSSFLLQGFKQFEPYMQPAVDTPTARAKAKLVDEFSNEAILFPGPKATIRTLRKLCRMEDRINSGCIPRLQVERWLQRELRPLVSQLDAETILDMLAVHTYGKTGRFILYPAFIDALASHLGTEESGDAKPASRKATPQAASPGKVGGSGGRRAVAGRPGAHEDDLEDSAHAATLQKQLFDGCEEDDVGAGAGGRPDSASSRPGTAHSYYSQYRTKAGSRADVDAFNRIHFARLRGVRGKGVTPKVGVDPLNVEEVRAVHEALSEQHNPLQRSPSPEMRRRIALKSVSLDESEGVLVPRPRPLVDSSEQESLREQILKEEEAELARRYRIRDALQSSWEEQTAEKAKLQDLYLKSESAWPYGPIHRPELRLPLSFPRA